MKKSVNVILILALFLIAAVAISGCSGYGGSQTTPPPVSGQQPSAQPETPPAPPNEPEPVAASEKTVEITAAGFSPNPLTIKAGDTVTFVNKDTAQHWPASAVHPAHTVYPGSDINKCGTAEAATIFDSCNGLATGETFEFTFTHVGSWKYHDHLNPSLWGTIVVE